VSRDERWLDYAWSFVRPELPRPPAEVLEIGCGSYGGLVPALLRGGYAATGVDPEAPTGPDYRQAEFEGYDPPRPLDAVVASTSLHHVADLGLALDRIAGVLAPGGTVVVIEWAGESFDEATARWCFDRLPATGPQHEHTAVSAHREAPLPAAGPEREHNWLAAHREAWLASGEPWQQFHAGWRAAEGLHAGADVVRGLDAWFARRSCGYGPYFFPDLAGTTEADEQAAIDAGQIQPTGIRWTGVRR
jgi:SAM-dependent methyltransferase